MAKINIIMKGQVLKRGKRYLCGVSSGLGVDHHGERMTERCIKSFMNQANSGDILLYPDIHGIRASKDMGILTKAQIMENGDWYTEYRMYDSDDFDPSVHQEKMATNDTLWRQMTGKPPYSRPREFGFSIEGIAPEESIVHNGMDRAMDAVDLDGVILVPRPAYPPSVANAVAKALGDGVPSPENGNTVFEKIAEYGEIQNLDEQRYQIEAAFEDLIRGCTDEGELKKYFDDYRDAIIPILIQYAGVAGEDIEKSEDPYSLPLRESLQVLKDKVSKLGGAEYVR